MSGRVMHLDTTAPPSVDSRVGSTRLVGLLRVRDWLHFVLLPVVCFQPSLPPQDSLPALVRGIVMCALILGWGYLLNGIADRHLDRVPSKNGFVGAGNGPMRRHFVLVVVLPCAALAIAASAPPVVLLASIVSVICGAVYSVGPRLKALPFLGTVLNLGCFAPLALVGTAGPTPTPEQWMLMGAFCCLLLQNQLFHEAGDAGDDRDGDVFTTFAFLGPRASALVATLAGAGVCAIAGWLATGALLLWSAPHGIVFMILFPVLMWRDGNSPQRMLRHRKTQRLASAWSGAALFVQVVAVDHDDAAGASRFVEPTDSTLTQMAIARESAPD